MAHPTGGPPALTSTTSRDANGSGAKAAHHAKNDLLTIDGSSEDLNRRYADEDVKIATPAVFEAKHPDGDPVTIKKKHEGLIIVFSDSFIFVRGLGFGAREVKAVRSADVTVERITTVLDDIEVPGLRIVGQAGGPKFALAVAQAKEAGDPAEQSAVRDEIFDLLTS